MDLSRMPESSESPPHTPLLPSNRYPSPPRQANDHLPPNHYSPPLAGSRSYSTPQAKSRKMGFSTVLTVSYVLDWMVIFALAIACIFMNDVKPNMRPFALDNPEISYPHKANETVPPKILFLCNSILPILIILIVTLVFVPGRTVPRGTPRKLVWMRKLWELHIGWLGIALSLFLAWFVTNGLKNLEGRPRPDMLARCKPDLSRVNDFYVGGYRLPVGSSSNQYTFGHMVNASICTNTDTDVLYDGFRSFPSGHSSSAAAGLVYLSLFLASKFAVTIPYLSPSAFNDPHTSYDAFPSRTMAVPTVPTGSSVGSKPETTRLANADDSIELIAPYPSAADKRERAHERIVTAARLQAASPPLYLLLLTLLPTFTAIFIAASRWFDFRHHSTDILTGFVIGVVCAIFSFRYYHLPISYGGGWAWGPRSADKALWAGVGSYSYATDHEPLAYSAPRDLESGMR